MAEVKCPGGECSDAWRGQGCAAPSATLTGGPGYQLWKNFEIANACSFILERISAELNV